MQPALVVQRASSTTAELTLGEGEQTIGRAADADLRLDETFVSAYHARVNWHNGHLAVLDLDSTNGTMVNGVPVVGWTSLSDGDVIEFGGVEAVVLLPEPSGPGVDTGPVPPPMRPGHRPAPSPANEAVVIDLTEPSADSGPLTGPTLELDPRPDGPRSAGLDPGLRLRHAVNRYQEFEFDPDGLDLPEETIDPAIRRRSMVILAIMVILLAMVAAFAIFLA